MDEEEPEQRVRRGQPSPTIQAAYTGNKLVYQSSLWNDVTDLKDFENRVHPVVAENMSLKRRLELLVKLVAESRFNVDSLKKDIKEAQDILDELKDSTGINMPEDNATLTETLEKKDVKPDAKADAKPETKADTKPDDKKDVKIEINPNDKK
ncbi:circumsporozoite protein, putative [Trichomonas vaginalis G3]|uniref:Circumsporozoite protein, putative n=1 Tax=Trichomonas vaginalis (strain ATCC PRA-98 / G3) TaxID=412133 RepID=A2DWG2_TRIV3|nr:hypothetical protein TVAGG3_0428650 [Trichomonas vaginalis G3]EAY15302.1 circumsporozoite protein, putative [Trichomonas vaginalis G3]KAI5536600.1 hypothetical protein TVAGG3_0428650 [Trichomonas vaginalis G3]|eukprot:XP_001327525.1 circumsporozoite protein [Trichomonas vaginalis G3]